MAAMNRRVRDMVTVTAWVVGILWVVRWAVARFPALAPLGRVLP